MKEFVGFVFAVVIAVVCFVAAIASAGQDELPPPKPAKTLPAPRASYAAEIEVAKLIILAINSDYELKLLHDRLHVQEEVVEDCEANKLRKDDPSYKLARSKVVILRRKIAERKWRIAEEVKAGVP